VSVLLNAGDGTFPATPNYKVNRNPESIVVGDFNRDSRRDLAVANAGSNTVSVLLGNGDGTFQAAANFAAGPGPTAVALGDFNRDNNQDLVVSNYGNADYYAPPNFVTATVSVLLGNGDGTFRPAQAFASGTGPNAVAVADFNGDGVQDLAVADYGIYPQRGTTLSILVGNGDGSFRSPQALQSGNAPSCVAVGDINRDGIQDLASCNYNDNNVAILLGNGDATFRPAGTVAVGAAPWLVQLDDLNADQVPDLAVTGHWSDIVSTAMGNGDGTFQPHRWFFTDRGPTGLVVADLNGDGRRDLATANYFSTTISVLLGNGDGTMQAAQQFGADLAPMGLAAGDFNADGQPDLAAGNYFSSSISIFMNRTSAPRAATPAFNPPGGTYVGAVTVAMATTTAGATIHYTIDGSTPTALSPVYTGPISVTQTRTVRAIATASGMTDSNVAGATYTIQVATPTFSLPAGTYHQPQTVTVSTTTGGAAIYYTTDGTTPTTASARYTGPIPATRTMTIRAIAVASGMADSAVASVTYTLQAATPTFNPPGGAYLLPQFVSISAASPNVTIYYTTDGSTPTTSSTQYTGSIFVGLGTTTIRAIAVVPGWSQSAVASAIYKVGL
jgi:hypothetical protein